MKKMMKNNKGFTLIELVIVIAILGVLAAVAITMFPKLADSSRGGADVTRATQIKSAISTYIAESGDKDGDGLGLPVNAAGGPSTASDAEALAALTSLQTGVTVGTVDYGPYLENIDADKDGTPDDDPDNYAPQQDGMTKWEIIIDATTGNVTVNAVQ
jgi:type IV pilus assembly protein PilA